MPQDTKLHWARGMRLEISLSRKKKTIGYCIGRSPQTKDKKKYAIELKVLFVQPEHRKKGHGAKLLERFLKQAKTLGFSSVYLTPSPYGEEDSQMGQSQLEKFYKRFGFRKNKDIMVLKKI